MLDREVGVQGVGHFCGLSMIKINKIFAGEICQKIFKN